MKLEPFVTSGNSDLLTFRIGARPGSMQASSSDDDDVDSTRWILCLLWVIAETGSFPKDPGDVECS
eukprot:m.1116700 g.1116700  ORF g.1116700 m.1116700 type:complete len:66 (-) comp24379_c0_seq3:23-220(-)